jgi:hypothetical protein
MSNLERRLEALETLGKPPWRWVFRHEHETDDEAKQRQRIQPGGCVIVFSQLDAEL